MSQTVRVETRERRLIAALALVGMVLRCWAFGRLGLTHFDEGIYAIAGLWALAPAGLGALDAGVIPYAPAGYPVAVGVSYGLFGVSDRAAILPAGLAGVAAIPAAGWIGRRTFGPGAGAAGAAFAALSLAAIAFSRKALTDMPFLVCWLFALGAAARFLERPGAGRAVLLGAAVALAQYFKYNGWIAGATALLAAVAGAAVDPAERRRGAVARTFGLGGLAAVVAGGLYAPWFLFVDRHGGYAALLHHQRGYLGATASWPRHWSAQLAQLHALSGAPALPAAAWVLAWCGAWWVAGTPLRPARFVVGLVVGAVLLATAPSIAWWAGLAAAPWLLADRSPWRRVLGAWWLVLSVLTPFYHPYARLWLPLHAAGWIVLAGAVATLVRAAAPDGPRRWTRTGRLALAAAWVAVLGSVIQTVTVRPAAFPAGWVLEPAPSLRDAADALAAAEPRPSVLLFARRPLALYLSRHGAAVRLAARLPDLLQPFPAGTRAVVDEALIVPETDAGRALTDLGAFWTVDARFDDRPDPVTVLDVVPAAAYRSAPRPVFRIWRLSPAARAAARIDHAH